MGKFRHIDVTQNGELKMVDVDGDGRFENSCSGWVELYRNAAGWDTGDRSLMFDYRDRHLDDWYGLDNYDDDWNDEASAARWNLPPGQKAWLCEHSFYGGARIWLAGKEVVENMNVPFTVNGVDPSSWNDNITSVLFSPVADLGGPYKGEVGIQITLSTANPCYANDPDVSFLWELVGPTSCSISDPAARRPTVVCDKRGSYTIKLTVALKVPETGNIIEASDEGKIIVGPSNLSAIYELLLLDTK